MVFALRIVGAVLSRVAVTLYLGALGLGYVAWRIEEDKVVARAAKYSVVIVLFVLGFLAVIVSCATPNKTGFSIRPEILQSFRQIQQEFSIETARCLLGSVGDDGHVEITGVYPPTILDSSVSSVRFKGCPEGTVGWFHNHVSAPVTGYCALSGQDMKTGDKILNSFAITIVGCSPDLFLYRFRGDPDQRRLEVVRGSGS